MRKIGHRPLQSNYATYINKYTLEGNNKMINTCISRMRSNRTSILRIDPALIPLLGFSANNKIIICYTTPNMTKDLSINNVVMVGVLDTYPCRLKHGDYAPAQALTMKTT
jgi:hypothetical protein